MPATNSYMDVAREYADEVRVLFSPTAVPTGERGEPGSASPADLAAQAEKLAPLSSKLTAEAASKLERAAHPADSVQASTQLLAKALTDLRVSAYLLEAADDEKAGIVWAEGRTKERGTSEQGTREELLQIVLGEVTSTSTSERSAAPPQDLAGARFHLAQTIEDTLAVVSERTSRTGEAALSGIFGIGLSEVGQAVSLFSQNVAELFGKADKLSRLYGLVRDFAYKAYESVLALLGPSVATIAGQQVLNWIAEIKEATFFGTLLEKLYQTKQTHESLLPVVNGSNAEERKFVTAIQGVEGLSVQCMRQTDLVDKLLKGMKYLGAGVAILPYGKLVMAATYVLICGYVVLNGADYVDADRVKLLNRVPGVRQIVTANLANA